MGGTDIVCIVRDNLIRRKPLKKIVSSCLLEWEIDYGVARTMERSDQTCDQSVCKGINAIWIHTLWHLMEHFWSCPSAEMLILDHNHNNTIVCLLFKPKYVLLALLCMFAAISYILVSWLLPFLSAFPVLQFSQNCCFPLVCHYICSILRHFFSPFILFFLLLCTLLTFPKCWEFFSSFICFTAIIILFFFHYLFSV